MTSAAVYELAAGSVVVVSEWPEDEMESLVEELVKVAGHRNFLVLFVAEDGGARVFGSEEIASALKVALA